jgi:hypothetical protein
LDRWWKFRTTTRRALSGAGLQTAALAFGGKTTVAAASTEEYDGTSWTAGGNLNTARSDMGGAGLQTAGLVFGGRTTVIQLQLKNTMVLLG